MALANRDNYSTEIVLSANLLRNIVMLHCVAQDDYVRRMLLTGCWLVQA